MSPITIVLLGEPVPWARSSGGRSVVRFTPPRQRINLAHLRQAAQQAMLTGSGYTMPPLDGPLSIAMLFELAIPRSWSRKKQEAAIRREIWPAKTPDFDNLEKQLMDSCKGVVWRDDCLICRWSGEKRYGIQPKLVLTVAPLIPS